MTRPSLRAPSVLGLGLVLVLVLMSFATNTHANAVAIAVQGLTVGMILYLISIGLSLVYGLGNVLNLSHTGIFMLGGFVAGAVSERPEVVLALAAVILSLTAGVVGGGSVGGAAAGPASRFRPLLTALEAAAWIAAAYVAYRCAEAFAVFGVVSPAAPATRSSLVVIMSACGLVCGSVRAAKAQDGRRPGAGRVGGFEAAVRPALGIAAALTGCGLAVWLTVEIDTVAGALRQLPGDAQFPVSMAASAVLGAVAGWFIDAHVVRPLRRDHTKQIVGTFFALVGTVEFGRLVFGSTPVVVPRPPALDGTTGLFGATISDYRFAIILIGLAVIAVVAGVLRWSQLGLKIRAAVQDAETTEALGVDVLAVQRQVFVAGSALAGLAGGIAAPFLGANLDMAFGYITISLVVIMIGGLGATAGTAWAAVVVGLGLSVSEAQVLAWGLPSSLSDMAAVVLMVVILLIRPRGLFVRRLVMRNV